MNLMQALYHWARLWYYSTALDHVGPMHPDATYLTMCCIESQRIVTAFLDNHEGA